jgi:hypothetical protein
MTDEADGLENPEKIDVVGLAPDGDYVVLGIAQARVCDGSDRLLLAVQGQTEPDDRTNEFVLRADSVTHFPPSGPQASRFA